MIIGVPKEIKNNEYRVSLTNFGVTELKKKGHTVLVQSTAGAGVGISDEVYSESGAEIIASAEEVFAKSDMILKVKEPQPKECEMLRKGQILFTYLHLAADRNLTESLIKSGVTGIAYETITDVSGQLPLLAPMSVVAGRLSVQEGANYLKKIHGGKGILLSGTPGVKSGKVVVIGAGVVGSSAMQIAIGMGAEVVVFDKSIKRLAEIDAIWQGRVRTLYSTEESVIQEISNADLVIGAVLIPGGAAPKVITKEMLKMMEPGSVIVDVAIDQGGCFETSKATTHQDPIYVVDSIIHYCVANMPGAAAKTSTFALTNATMPYTLKLANMGWKNALKSDPGFAAGLNVHEGKLCYEAVAKGFNIPYDPTSSLL